jgi:hypothetical protein
MNAPANGRAPETHERIREEDIQETLDIFREGNQVLPKLSDAQHQWLQAALAERRHLCATQFVDGQLDAGVQTRLRELDGYINSVCPEILKVLHFLSRIRAIIPVLYRLKAKLDQDIPDETQRMVAEMEYRCSRAEAQSAIEGLAALRVRPRILDEINDPPTEGGS